MKFIILFFLCSIFLFANWKTQRENLEKVHIVNDFRIFYSLNGKDALTNKVDTNHNNIPDIIENIGLQLKITDEILNKVLKFKKPLDNSVYKSRVKYIDIHVLNLKKGLNGVAGDAVIEYNYKNIDSSGKSVSMAISNNIKVGNLTPMHELFHIYQNGYSMIKNSWYSEGTARWSEMIFRDGFGKTRTLPTSKRGLDYLLQQTYGAKYFWNRIAYLCSSKIRFNMSKYKHINYIGTKVKVIQSNDIHGFEFMRIFFNNLDIADNEISEERKLLKNNWKEKEQKSKLNNIYILKAIVKSIKQSNNRNTNTEELNSFVILMNNYINNIEK